jgi:hypothetical protein
MEREDVQGWMAAYERLWRTPGTDGLGEVFANGASYRMSPWDEPVVGLAALAELWEAERDGHDETFTMTSQVVAVEGDAAIVRAEVAYEATGNRWRDLWVLRFDEQGRCTEFEEWAFAPDQGDGHS